MVCYNTWTFSSKARETHAQGDLFQTLFFLMTSQRHMFYFHSSKRWMVWLILYIFWRTTFKKYQKIWYYNNYCSLHPNIFWIVLHFLYRFRILYYIYIYYNVNLGNEWIPLLWEPLMKKKILFSRIFFQWIQAVGSGLGQLITKIAYMDFFGWQPC